MDQEKCLICGEPATSYFGACSSLPLCSNRVCEQTLIDEINQKLSDAADDAQKEEQ